MSTAALRVSTPVIVLSAGATRGEALAAMRDHGVRHLPLVTRAPDGGDAVCVGLLVDRDLVLGGSADGPVGGLARTDVPHVAPTDAPPVTARAVLRGGCDAALVVDDGCLVGIVTATDVLRDLVGAGAGAGTGTEQRS